MRLQSRIKPQFLIDQATRRKDIAETPGDSQNSVPALRTRVTVLEEILAVRPLDEVNPV